MKQVQLRSMGQQPGQDGDGEQSLATGGYLDATTGLYKFGTRYYSPTLGRWTQQDLVGGSVGKMGSGNAYVYADNAPVMTTDPSGKISDECFAAILAAVVLDGSALWALSGIGIGASIWAFGLPEIGAGLGALLYLVTLYVAIDVSMFIFNNSIANYCGLAKIPYLPNPFNSYNS